MAKKKVKSRKHRHWLFAVFFILLLVGVALLGRGWKQVIPMELTVADYAGINVDTDKVYFGALPPGGSSTRTLSVSNTYGRPLEVTLVARGQLAGWVGYSPRVFLLEVGESRQVNVTTVVPTNAKLGNYSGNTIIHFQRK